MKIIKQFIPIIILLLLTTSCSKEIVKKNTVVTADYSESIKSYITESFRIVVVSCARIQLNKKESEKDREQVIWEQIRKEVKPDLLLILGDIVYLDENRRKVKGGAHTYGKNI
ncbi:MAG: hypothetical protein GQ582_12790 [Methyloprofundus sp.]|nr:hypothetical protein [Methyloprofundus sp.]